jgi:hypothetical protein
MLQEASDHLGNFGGLATTFAVSLWLTAVPYTELEAMPRMFSLRLLRQLILRRSLSRWEIVR